MTKSAKNFQRKENVGLIVDMADPDEVMFYTLFTRRFELERAEERIKRRRGPGPESSRNRPTGRVLEALRYAAEHGFKTREITEILYPDEGFNPKTKARYYATRRGKWVNRGWVVTHGHDQWEVTEKIKAMLTDT